MLLKKIFDHYYEFIAREHAAPVFFKNYQVWTFRTCMIFLSKLFPKYPDQINFSRSVIKKNLARDTWLWVRKRRMVDLILRRIGLSSLDRKSYNHFSVFSDQKFFGDRLRVREHLQVSLVHSDWKVGSSTLLFDGELWNRNKFQFFSSSKHWHI